MLQILALLAMLAIAVGGLISILSMSDSPNPRCFEDKESFCPYQSERNDQGNP